MAAARNVLADLRVRQNGELFIFGFSQGGHSALALQRELERMRVKVDGTAVVGEVFDVERWFLGSLAREDSIAQALYVSYLLLAFDDIYDVFESTDDVFRRQYAGIVRNLFDMRHFFDDVMFALPPPARDLLKPSYYAQVTTNRDDPMRVRLRENAVDRWRPEAPVLAFHSQVDEEVPYDDALVSVDGCGGAARRSSCARFRFRSRQQLDPGTAAGGAVVPGDRLMPALGSGAWSSPARALIVCTFPETCTLPIDALHDECEEPRVR